MDAVELSYTHPERQHNTLASSAQLNRIRLPSALDAPALTGWGALSVN